MTHPTDSPMGVIGVGRAGVRILSALPESTYKDTYFFDSDRADLTKYTKSVDDSNILLLKLPDEKQYRTDRNERAYLPDDFPYRLAPGTGNYRPLGRYYVDNDQSAEPLQNALTNFIDSLSTVSTNDEIEITTVIYAGGGTGSGAYLLLTALMDWLAQDADINLTVHGIWVIPKRTIVDTEFSVGANYLRNTVLGIRELDALLTSSSTCLIKTNVDGLPSKLSVGPGVFGEHSLFGVSRDSSGLQYTDSLQIWVEQWLRQENTEPLEHELENGVRSSCAYMQDIYRGKFPTQFREMIYQEDPERHIAYPELSIEI